MEELESLFRGTWSAGESDSGLQCCPSYYFNQTYHCLAYMTPASPRRTDDPELVPIALGQK